MKNLKPISVLVILGILLSACSLVPSAWKSIRPPAEAPTAVPTAAGPTQTVEEVDESVSTDLETQMDADLKQIDQDLKAIDEEVKNY